MRDALLVLSVLAWMAVMANQVLSRVLWKDDTLLLWTALLLALWAVIEGNRSEKDS